MSESRRSRIDRGVSAAFRCSLLLCLGFTLFLSGCAGGGGASRSPDPSPTVPPAVARWIESMATPLAPSIPLGGAIEDQLAAARVVGLGEATHGQQEAFALKRRLTLHLVRNHEFRVVAFEASASRAIVCDDYIAGRSDDRAKAIGGLGMLIWQVEENGRLLDDLRAWNASAEPGDRVRFIGCDAQNGASVLARLEFLLGSENASSVAELRALLPLSQTALVELMGGNASPIEAFLVRAKEEIERVRRRVHKTPLTRPDEVDLRLDEYLAHLGLYASPGERDRAMAELLLAQLDKKDRCVVWAHNAHVQRSPLTFLGSDALAMGGHLAEKLGDGYYAVGFFFGEGTFQANAQDAEGRWRFRRYTHGPAPRGSIGAELSEARSGDYLLDFRSAPEIAAVNSWLLGERGHRWWGGYNIPEDFEERTSDAQNLSQCHLRRAYDGLAFHGYTRAAEPIDRTLILSD